MLFQNTNEAVKYAVCIKIYYVSFNKKILKKKTY